MKPNDCLPPDDGTGALRVLTVTGHRLGKLAPNQDDCYSPRLFSRLVDLARASLENLCPKEVVTGMALGWDQAIAQACIELGIPFIAALPCPGQSSRWFSQQAVRDYEERLRHAKGIVCVWQEPGFEASSIAGQMMNRNQWMIDRALYAYGKVLALHDGSSGGTGNCVRYAQSVGIVVLNYWQSWVNHSGFWRPQ